MSDTVRISKSGTATIHSDIAQATAIDMSRYAGLSLFLPAGLTAPIEVWSLGADGVTYHNTDVSVSPGDGVLPTAEPKCVSIDAAIFPSHTIKLVCDAADDETDIGWRAKA